MHGGGGDVNVGGGARRGVGTFSMHLRLSSINCADNKKEMGQEEGDGERGREKKGEEG